MLLTTRHKPFILKLAEVKGLTPLRIFVLVLLALGPLAYYLNTPLSSVINLAYCSAIANFICTRYKKYLQQLRAELTIPNDTFEEFFYRLDHLTLRVQLIALVLAPTAFLLVNWQSQGVRRLLAGEPQAFDFYYSLLVAMLAWIVICQLVTLTLVNIRAFSKLSKFAKVDLVNTNLLAPFLMVGVSTFWIFALSYAIIPIAFIQDLDLLRPSIMAMLVTLPFAFLVLVIPALSIRSRIRQVRLAELNRVKQALLGEREALRESRLQDEMDSVTTSSLLQYRQYLQTLSDWPADDTALRRLFVYIVVPMVSWAVAFAFEQFVETLL